MQTYDAAIVGGGPAGAWAAYRLAAAGARVCVVDGSHPREKPCGGGISARALRLLAPIAGELCRHGLDVQRAYFSSGGRTARVPLERRGADARTLVVVSRRSFDGALLASARAAGAEHLARRATGVDRRPDGWRITTEGGAVAAAWLIGADGANSLVRRRVARPFSRAELSIASGYYVHDRTEPHIDVEFTERPPGYLWSFPRVDHLAVGMCGQADGTSSAELLEASARWIRARYPVAAAGLTRYSWPIPSLPPSALDGGPVAGDRWMLVGDAAGLVDPITREGIFFALQSGALAARALAGREPGRTYADAVSTTIHRELRRAAAMKPRFFRPAFTSLLVDALHRSARIRSIMANLVSGEQTYLGLRRRLLFTGEWRLAYEYLRLGR